MQNLFAEGGDDLSFSIVHFINIGSQYKFVYKDSSNEPVTSVSLSPGELNESFVSLYLQHNSTLLVKGITVSASDLETSAKTAVYPYTMSLADAKGNAIEWIPDEEGNGSGYAHLVSRTTVFRYRETGGSIKLADFSIDLSDDSEVAEGVYDGSISLYYVVI